MNSNLPKLRNYFTHNKEWANLWLSNKKTPYSYLIFEFDNHEFIAYQHPFRNKVFWHITNFGNLIQDNMSLSNMNYLLQTILDEAKNRGNVVMVKVNWNSDFVNFVLSKEKFSSDSDYISNKLRLENTLRENFDNIQIPLSNLMNNSTIFLDMNSIPEYRLFSKNINQDLENFFVHSKEFWSKTSSNVRRYTKKAIQHKWKVELDKNNFEQAYELLKQKSLELDFFIHDKDFLELIVTSKHGYLICLKNSSDNICACWFGFSFDNYMFYWYGANTTESLNNYGQYLIHLTAIMLCKKHNLDIYDLGGYSPKLGFGKFKELYHGRVFESFGDYDFVLMPNYYNVDKAMIFLKNLIAR
jgi:FemAB family